MQISALVKDLVPAAWRLRRSVSHARKDGEPELHFVPALCKADCISLDVGANRGIYSYIMQQHSKAVIAFEPNAAYATFLRRALSKVKVIEAAASDRKGHATIRIPYRSAVAGMGTIESSNTIHEPFHEAVIETLLLNSLQLPTVGFMKIDVEGHELAALVGATDILERDRPNLLIEAENRHRPNAVESVAEFLAGYGYDGFFYFDKSLLPISRFDMSTFQSLDETTHDYSGPYVNNFIFVQPEGIKSLQSVLARADWL